jgi:hypothetical protein
MDEVAKLSQKDKVQEAVNASHTPEVSLVSIRMACLMLFVADCPTVCFCECCLCVNKLSPSPVCNSNAPCLSISTSYEEYSSSLLSSLFRLASYFPPIASQQDENQKRIEDLVKEILGSGCLQGADNIFRDGSELVQNGNGH